ncbi:MAG: Ig-like domain-containing protein [Anaerolineae bacterium]
MKPRSTDPIARILSLLVLAALLLSACGPATPAATPTTGEPTATPTPAPTQPPTATPLPLPAPRLLYRSPAPGEPQPLEAPLELIFDQPMDRASVEAAFTLSPAVEGAFTWTDDRTVSYTGEALQRATRYQVTLAPTARNAEGTPLEEPVTFDFTTVGYLAVSQVMPAPDSDDLDPDTIVTVVFDHPVVPLTALNRQGELPQPLTLVPPVQGEGEWLNTSIYQFRPQAGLLPATHYKARVAAGLTPVGQEATSGAVLDEDYTWEFTTLHPAVLEVQPENRFQHLGPSDVISVTFNQPMDHASAEALFSLQAGSQADPIPGTFRWTGGATPIATETMVFAPDPPLPRDTQFAATLAAGARAGAGTLVTEEDTAWRFATVRNPGIRLHLLVRV